MYISKNYFSMTTFRLDDKKLKPLVFAATIIYFLSTIIFFTSVEIPHKITYCVGFLTLASLWLCPWQISLALLFSTLGDYMGSCANFIGQMGFFAVAHIFYILYFVKRYFRKVEVDGKLTDKAIGYLTITILSAIVLAVFVFVKVIPGTPSGIIRVGVIIYTIVILLMYVSAMLQRSSLYALGAVLFVFSDFIIGWNKFVEPVPYRDYLVLVTYFLAQWLLFIRSTKYRVPHQIRLLRF